MSGGMRMIVAIVQPFAAGRARDALHQVPGVTGATVTDARGFGRARRPDLPIAEVVAGTVGKVHIEVMVPAEVEDAVVETIRRAAHTGNRGDGKIYVAELTRAVRISTGEEGIIAV